MQTPPAIPSPTEPLAVDDVDSITELFARYPEVTEAQARRVVAHLRATRGKIGQDQKPTKTPKVAAPKAGAKPKLTAEELAELLGDMT